MINTRKRFFRSTVLIPNPDQFDSQTNPTFSGEKWPSYKPLYRLLGIGFLLMLFFALSSQRVLAQTVTVPQDGGSCACAIEADGEDTGTVTLDVEIANSNALAAPVTINYQTFDVSTQGSADYTPVSGSLIFSSTSPSIQTVVITLVNDLNFEANPEDFEVQWSSPNAAVTFSDDASTVQILDNDCFEFTPDPSGPGFPLPILESGGSLPFFVYYRDHHTQTITIDYATTAGGTATPNSDFTSSTGTVTFPSGGGTLEDLNAVDDIEQFSIPIIDDILGEGQETVEVELLNPFGSTGICGLDEDGRVIDESDKLSINDIIVSENSGTVSLNVSTFNLSKDGGFSVDVNVTTQNGSAVLNQDYNNLSPTLLTFTNNNAQNIMVDIINDTLGEGSEDFFVKLSTTDGPTFDGLGRKDTGEVEIFKNDEFSINSVTVDEDVVNAVLTVELLVPNSVTTTVDYTTVAGTAISGTDYISQSGTLTFAPNQTSKTISIPIINDLVTEGSEAFTVVLSNPVGSGQNPTISSGTGTVTINPSDVLTFNDVTVNEGLLNATVVLMMSESNPTPITIDFTPTDGTALFSNQDYIINSGTFTFTPGATTASILIPIDDTLDESTENFFVNLANSNGPTIPALLKLQSPSPITIHPISS